QGIGNGSNGTTGFQRIGPRNRPEDNVKLSILFTPTWNTAGTELTLTPVTPLEAGYRYRITFDNSRIVDTTNNTRNSSGFIPFTDPSAFDALAIANGTSDLEFSIGSDNMPLTVTPVQEPDTADNVSATSTRASVIEADPSSTESSFLTAQNAGFYTANNTSHAYISWTAPAKPVRRYRIWTRVGTNTPILISDNSAASGQWNISATRVPLPPTRTGFNISLTDLNTILNAEFAGLPGLGLANQQWNNNLSVQLGVSAVNSDGQEGDITFVTLQDNTGPALVLGSGLGRTTQYQNANDSVLLSRTADCSGLAVTADRVSCQKVANTVSGAPAATSFGQRVVVFDLSEPVDAASVVAANITLEDGTLPNNLNNNMNVAGAQTESDATIASAFPVSVNNGRATRIGVLFNNFFGIDTGDRLILRTGTTGTTGVKDIVGNVAKDVILNRTPFVDNFPPMIKSVTLDAANDTATVVFTKWVNASAEPAPAPTAARPTPGNFDWNRFALNLNNGDNLITSATHSINSNNEAQVVLKFTDIGYLRGLNSTDSACLTGPNSTGVGTRITMSNVESIDFTNTTTRSSASVSDDGTVAYENMLPDSAAPFQSPGAYLPSSGVGTRSSTNDTIPPRLSSNYDRRTLSTCSNGANASIAANTTTGTQTIVVALTEMTANDTSATATDSILNPANWALKVVDLGTTGNTCNNNATTDDRWNGKTGAALGTAAQASVTIQSVTLNSTDGSSCGRSPRYNINFTITNADTTNARFLAIGTVRLSGATVADRAGNAIGAAPTRVTWAYDPARPDLTTFPAGANPNPGWVVVP
ncbi:MAG: hypothetical protein JNG84_00730, partial [Archangium sp.]|nr:hypothetical protein [Archangium sp.]